VVRAEGCVIGAVGSEQKAARLEQSAVRPQPNQRRRDSVGGASVGMQAVRLDPKAVIGAVDSAV
jgi:hypothetical protein